MNHTTHKIRPVIYQLLPRLFGNGNLNNVEGGTIEKNGCGKFDDISLKALESIRGMGFTHVWYTGIIEHATLTDYSSHGIPVDFPDVVKGCAGSPYAIKDYYDVDPDLAISVPNRVKEFEALVTRTREAGMKVIIDFVPNHLARQYVSDMKPAGIKDFGEDDNPAKAYSPCNNFYYLPGEAFVSPAGKEGEAHWHEEPARATGNDCFSGTPAITDWYETVKLNYGIDYRTGKKHFDPLPDTWKKMRDVVLYWAGKGVDAFRCDMAGMVPVEFWHWLTGEVKLQFPDIQFIAEIYDPERYREFLFEARFDYLYDKILFYDTARGVIRHERPASDLSYCWKGTEGFHHQMLYFLENHDEQRIASDFFAGNPRHALPAMVVAATMLQNPVLIYFGQELGERGMEKEGFSRLDGRTTIFDYRGLSLLQKWNNQGRFDETKLPEEAVYPRSFYSRLLNLINNEPALRGGKFYDLMFANTGNAKFDNSSVYAFFRYGENQLMLVMANFSDNEVDYRLQVPHHFFNLAGLHDRLYFTGHDKLQMNKKIQFPAGVALNAGIGGILKGWSAAVYELEHS